MIDVTPKNPVEKIYIGDSVYAAFDGYSVTLTTENGFGPSNTIVLEPEVIEGLFSFVEYLKAKVRAAREAKP